MGNCLASPLDNHSSSAVQPSNPVSPTKARPIPVHDHEDTSKKRKSNDISSAENEAPPTVGVLEGVALTGRIVTPDLKMFTYSELTSATRNFQPDTLVGEGGFGRVFKGWVDERTYAPSKAGVGIPVAVKKSNPDSQQGLKEWQAEVKFLGKFSHPNLVKLLGYCWDERQFLLVYEYMQKGSLDSHLFKKPLSWDIRLKIMIGAARGLAFLHTTEKQVIYRDFKAANILLDRDFNAKLSDFGLAKLGPVNGDSHVTTGIKGTYGYAAPEYMATGHLYVRSDVYGFGVVLLEVLTGQRVIDKDRLNGKQNLVEWATPFLHDVRKMKKIMDPGLEGKYPSKAAFQAAQLILRCLESDPKNRPPMEEVLATLQQIRATKMSPKESKASARQIAAKRSQQNCKNYPCHHGQGPNHYPFQNRYGGNVAGAGGRARS